MTDPWSRRTFLTRGAAIAAAVTVLPLLDRSIGVGAAPTFAAAPTPDNAARAATSYAAMQQYFYVPAQKLYREHTAPVRGDQAYSYLWSFEETS